MERLTRDRSFDDGMDVWDVASAAPAATLAATISRYTWWRERTKSFDTRRELASTCGVCIVNLGARLEITDAGHRTIRVDEGEVFIGGMAQGTSLSRSTGDMEGVHVFMPIHELARLVGISVAELANRTVKLGDVLNREAEELGNRLLATAACDARLDALDTFFARRLSAAPVTDIVMPHILSRLRSDNVSAVAGDLGWSRKRLASWLQDRAGIRPAQYKRLARYERFTCALLREPDTPLAALAYDAGYVDQAHLSHDVRRLAGTTPGALRASLLPQGGGFRNDAPNLQAECQPNR